MTPNRIPFKEVSGAGLFVDTIYEDGLTVYYTDRMPD